MTALVFVIVLGSLLWIIVQSVVLAMLWGQQQRSQARADLLARLVGASPVDDDDALERAGPAPPVAATADRTKPPATNTTVVKQVAEPVRSDPAPELTFPPPVRQPIVPPAGEPSPRPDEVHVPAARGLTQPSDAPGVGSGSLGVSPESDLNPAELERGGTGLPAGSVLPDFELQTIDGESFGRSKLIGTRTVLLFLAVDSPGSAAVMESIRSPQVRKRSLPDLVVVMNGGIETASLRRWLGKLPKRVTVLLQDDTELATVLRVSGTPSAYVLDEQSRTRGPLRTGARAVLEALGVSTSQMTASARRSTNSTAHTPVTQRTYSGLPVGAPAPEIVVPLIGGGTWERAAGRSALLVFWDADCPPCQSMQAELAAQAATWQGFDHVVIARGEPAMHSDLAKFEAHLAVSIQRGFDISRLYHVLEAPAAVAIGPDGTIARAPAVGVSAVLALGAELRDRAKRATDTTERGFAS